MDGRAQQVSLQGQQICLLGVADPAFGGVSMSDAVSALPYDQAKFTLLLSHRPELIDAYVTQGLDLVLTGHAHGGQFRLPWLGGLFAPNQGLLPQYTAGLFTESNTNMIVSRGLGNSLFPFRLNNRPELVVVRLKPAT